MRFPPPAAAAAAALAACAASAWHIHSHSAPPSFDEAWYLEVSYRLWNALSEFRLADFAQEYVSAFRFKAPLLSVLSLPVYAVLGPSFEAARLANLPAVCLLALSLYGLGRRFFSPAAGALAVAVALTMPMFSALSRLYFTEAWLTALSAAFLWRWAESDALRREDEAACLGALAGLGMLAKVLFPLPLLGPVALTLWERRASRRELERPLKVLIAVAAAVALTWYGPNLVYVAGYMVRASAGDIAAHYAVHSPFDPRVMARFWNAMASDGSSYPVAFALVVALATLGRRRITAEPGLLFALAWLVPPLLVASLGRSKELRFAVTALPGAALALAGALDLLTRGKAARPWLFAAVLALPADLTIRQTFGHSLLPPTRLGPILLSAPRTLYGGPPSDEGGRDLDALAREVAARTSGPAVVVLGSEHGYLNANLLAAEAARQRLPQTYIHYGHMESKVENTVARLRDKDATHILFVTGLPPDEVVPGSAQVDSALRSLITAGALPFRSLGTLSWSPAGLKAELYERTGTVTMTGALR